jgi:murein DD-endopeptidase MepM/ murein hydrolase activator NlpD
LVLVLSLAAFGGAVGLTTMAPGRGTGATTTPGPSWPTALGSPGASGNQASGEPHSGAPGSQRPGTTPTPTPLPTDKTFHARSADPNDLTGYVWPLRNALISSRFAPRDIGGFLLIDGNEWHDGLDLSTHCGDKVRAAHDGVVLYAGRNFDVFLGYQGRPEEIYARLERVGRVNSLPIVIVVDNGDGYRSIYVHLKKADVEAGAVVHAGDVIGKEGQTGFATGCHLHYGMIRMDGEWQQVVPHLARFGYPLLVRERIDPLKVLPWGDQYAPQRLRDRVNPPSPSASPAPSSSASPSETPTVTPTVSPTASRTPAPTPSSS